MQLSNLKFYLNGGIETMWEGNHSVGHSSFCSIYFVANPPPSVFISFRFCWKVFFSAEERGEHNKTAEHRANASNATPSAGNNSISIMDTDDAFHGFEDNLAAETTASAALARYRRELDAQEGNVSLDGIAFEIQ